MREIKFRAKQINDNNWISGYGVIIGDGFCAIPYTIRGNTHNWKLTTIICDINTLGQYTGLKDKNGKEIYEGDIVRNKEIGGYGMVYIGIVRYYDKDCRFGIDTTTTNKFTKRLLFTDGECIINDGHCTITYTDEYEIIGNIYDNPELIKEEEK